MTTTAKTTTSEKNPAGVDAMLAELDRLRAVYDKLPKLIWELQRKIDAEIGEHRSIAVDLSLRQSEVLNLVRMRLSNKEIGAKLNICERTVKFHVSKVLQKYKCSYRQELWT